MTARASSHTLQEPFLLKDKRGKAVLIRLYQDRDTDYDRLREMYREFEPKEVTQGLPPRVEESREEWLKSLLEGGINLLAIVEGKIVGHAVLLEMESGRRCEFLVFVHQDYQNRGIGTALSERVRDLAQRIGYCQIWLMVEAVNFKAIHVYRKVGFCLVGPREVECEMVISLEGSDEGS